MTDNFAGFLAILIIVAICIIIVAICIVGGTICTRLDRLIDAVNDLAYDDDDDDDDFDGGDDGEPFPAEDCECETVRFAS